VIQNQEYHQFKANLGYKVRTCLERKGRKGGREEGRKEGRKEGMKEGRKEPSTSPKKHQKALGQQDHPGEGSRTEGHCHSPPLQHLFF
jgi:predicted transposase YdaD